MNLPIVDLSAASGGTDSKGRKQEYGRSLHAIRLGLVVLIIVGLNRAHAIRREVRSSQVQPIELASMQEYMPSAVALESLSNQGFQAAKNSDGEIVALVTTTSPYADEIIGYSGPNEVLLLLDSSKQLMSAHLVRSGDTVEHAELVGDDTAFWLQFKGLNWGDSLPPDLDGVSGATLTSLAIVEAIALRLAGERLNLKFPADLELEEAQRLEPAIASLEARQQNGLTFWIAKNSSGEIIAKVYRTGTLVDSHEGYQGPTELLLLLDNEGVVADVKLRESYDNQPYVGYVEQEYSFWPIFRDRSLESLSELDLEKEGIEGVSGATMTSIAVAETIQKSTLVIVEAASKQPSQRNEPAAWRQWNWSWFEIVTAMLAMASVMWSRSSWKRRPTVRIAWQVLCFVWLGLCTGNLISIALLSGWTQAGAPVRLAPGLGALLVVAIIMPALMRSNVYCDHVCPHGALQQWLRPLARKRRSKASGRIGFSRLIAMVLAVSSFVILGLAYGAALLGVPLNLAWLEPFDTYLWQIGLTFSFIVWLVSLVLSLWRPMAYCQLACPTGRILDTLRRTRRTASTTRIDVGLLVLASCTWLFVFFQS